MDYSKVPFSSVSAQLRSREGPDSLGGYNALAYNTRGGNNAAGVVPPMPVTEMPMGNLYDWQRSDMRSKTRGYRGANDIGSTGVGAYQFESQTLRDTAEKVFGSGWRNTKFTPENQERLAEYLYDSVKSNPNRLAATWAMFGQNNEGSDMQVLPMTRAAYGGGNNPTYVYEGQPEGNFKAQRAMDISPEAVADLQRVQELKRRMLPLALGSMMSEDRGSQIFGSAAFREAMEGVEPYRLQNGVLTDSGEYVTDQDPSGRIRAQAALQNELNDAANAGVLGGGTTIQIGVNENGDPIFKGKSPIAFTYVNGQPVPYTGGVGAKTGATPTEDENKAAGYYRRLVGGQQEVKNVLSENPNVATQSIVPRYAEKLPVVGADVSNFLTSKDRQSVEAAQLDMLDAALTLNTGQAYTKEQLRGLSKAYFPQPGDTPQAIETKRRTLEAEIESAKLRAGRALKKAGQTPGMGAGPAANSGGDANDPLGILGGR